MILNDLSTITKHSAKALYADDAVLYCYDSNPAGLECALNDDLHAVANWLNDNKLTLNVDKTKAMLTGSDSKPVPDLGEGPGGPAPPPLIWGKKRRNDRREKGQQGK